MKSKVSKLTKLIIGLIVIVTASVAAALLMPETV